MRICLLTANFPPQRCGLGDHTYFLSGALAGMGHYVDVLTRLGDLDEKLYPLSINVRAHRVIKNWGTNQLVSVVKHVEKLNPDVLLIQYTSHAFDRHGITFAVNILPTLLRATGGSRVVTNFHELYIPFDGSVKHDLAGLWQRAMTTALAAGSHLLTVTATEWKRCLGRIGIRKRIEVVPVGSNIPRRLVTREDRVRIREGFLGSSKGVLIAGFGARHDRDIPAVLYGLQQIKRLLPAKLVWMGGGVPDQQDAIRIEHAMHDFGLNRHDVVWTGVLPHSEISQLLGACDVMVLPFLDGVSTRRTSAVTALQHELPVLTTHGIRPEPWFVHGDNIYLTPKGDREAFANGLVELAQRPELRDRIAQGASELYKSHFEWSVIAQQFMDFIEHRRS